MLQRSLLLLIAATLLAFAETGNASEILVDEPAEVEGTEDCVRIRAIRRTEVLDDRNVLFHMTGGRIYRNFLPRRCPSLSMRKAFMYETRINQLCRADRITIVDSVGIGAMRGPSCGLGRFYPVSENEVKSLKEQIERAREAGITSPDPE